MPVQVSSQWMPLLDSIYPGDRRRIAIDADYTLLRLLCTSPANQRSGYHTRSEEIAVAPRPLTTEDLKEVVDVRQA